MSLSGSLPHVSLAARRPRRPIRLLTTNGALLQTPANGVIGRRRKNAHRLGGVRDLENAHSFAVPPARATVSIFDVDMLSREQFADVGQLARLVAKVDLH